MRRIGVSLVAAILLAAVGAEAQEFAAGDIVITDSWMRANLRDGANAAVYFDLRLGGDEPDTLIAATSPTAGEVELRATSVVSEVARSIRLDDIAIPPGDGRRFWAGGYHLILRRVPVIEEGELVQVTLTFARNGELTIQVPVLGARAAGPN